MFVRILDLSTPIVIARSSADCSGVAAPRHRPDPFSLWRDLTRDWSRWSKGERVLALVMAGTPPLLLFAGGIHAMGSLTFSS